MPRIFSLSAHPAMFFVPIPFMTLYAAASIGDTSMWRHPLQEFLLGQGGQRESGGIKEENEERDEEREHYALGRTLAEWDLKWNGSPWGRDRGRERNGVGLLASLICHVRKRMRGGHKRWGNWKREKEMIVRQGCSWFWSGGGGVYSERRWQDFYQHGLCLACADGLVVLKAWMIY